MDITITANPKFPFPFKVGDVVIHKGEEELQLEIIDLPTRCPILGIGYPKGTVLLMKCLNDRGINRKDQIVKFGFGDYANLCYNRANFTKVGQQTLYKKMFIKSMKTIADHIKKFIKFA